MRTALLVLTSIILTACGDGRPEHYYVFCEDRDYNGWRLIDHEEQDGFILACTYQSPDQTQSYTARCTDEGCD